MVSPADGGAASPTANLARTETSSCSGRQRRAAGARPSWPILRGILSVLCCSLFVTGRAAAQESPAPRPQNESFHDSTPGSVRLNDLPQDRRQRVQALWTNVVCACPKENWSRTLHHCKDACADPQKEEILAAVAAGRSDDQILAEQELRYGQKVLAGGDVWSKVLPFAFLGIGAVLVFVVLSRWRRAAPARASSPRATAGEAQAVERELAEIE